MASTFPSNWVHERYDTAIFILKTFFPSANSFRRNKHHLSRKEGSLVDFVLVHKPLSRKFRPKMSVVANTAFCTLLLLLLVHDVIAKVTINEVNAWAGRRLRWSRGGARYGSRGSWRVRTTNISCLLYLRTWIGTTVTRRGRL